MKKPHPLQQELNFDAKQVLVRKDDTLFLTYIRTSQQANLGEIIKKARRKLRGRTFEIRQNPPKFCGKNSIVIISKKKGRISKVDIKNITCNSWTCPDCSLKKALQVKYLLRDIIIKNNLEKFLTLTLDPKIIPQEFLSAEYNKTHKYITKIFNAFLVSLKRDKVYENEKIKYVWVIEFQKKGNAHMHILFNRLPHIDSVRKIWTRVGGGVSMKVIKVKSMAGISNYIGNYIVKGLKGEKSGKNTFNYFEKRYSISRSCIRPTSSISEFMPGSSLQQKMEALQSANLDGLNYSLMLGEEKTFEL